MSGKRSRLIRLAWLVVALAALALCLCIFVLAGCNKAEAPPATPVPTSPGGTATAEPAISVDSPESGDTVSVPIKVKGTASVFEATLLVAVRDAQGNTLCQVVATASEGAPGRGDYEVEIAFPPPAEAMEGSIEAFTESPKDGSVEDLVSVPVTIAAEQPAIVISSLQCGQEVGSPLLVEGTASVFEAALVIVVRDSQGEELARVPVQASQAAPERGAFSQEVTFPLPEGPQRGTIEAFSDSPQDGSVINLFSVPVILTP
jgi:hypothetical protein